MVRYEDEAARRKGAKKSPFADSPYECSFLRDAEDTQCACQTPEKDKKHGFFRRLVSLFAILCVVVFCCCITAFLVNQRWEEETELLSQAMNNKLDVLREELEEALQNSKEEVAPAPDVEPLEAMSPSEIYAANADAVVLVTNMVLETEDGKTSELYYNGSGFAISSDGYIVTNYHVIKDATKLLVTTVDGTELEATLVGYEDSNDVALLKVSATDMPHVKLGSSTATQVGDRVTIIGNPLGELTSTLTVGYLSGKDRILYSDGTSINMLQTDAAVNPGNSGGPVFNSFGEVVGIVTSKYSGTTENGAVIEGLGFAIPMDDVMDILEQLRQNGHVTSAYLGVKVRDVDSNAQTYGLPAGAFVVEVSKGYAGEAADLRAKDIIVNLGGYDVSSSADIGRILRKLKPGETTTITVYRDGREVNLSITLDEKPQTDLPAIPNGAPTVGDYEEWYSFFKKYFGIE